MKPVPKTEYRVEDIVEKEGHGDTFVAVVTAVDSRYETSLKSLPGFLLEDYAMYEMVILDGKQDTVGRTYHMSSRSGMRLLARFDNRGG